MTIPFWCVAIACVLPYLYLPFTWKQRFGLEGGFDNAYPRQQEAVLTGVAQRAIAAHKNAFEALPVFGLAVVVSHLASADALWCERLAITWVAARLLHGVFYITNIHPLRSVSWFVALAAALGMFLLPIL